MNIEPVDPRDTRWEQHGPTYRVYFWDGGALEEFEVGDADVPEILSWAEDEARRTGRTYVVWLRAQDAAGNPGLIRLAGWEQPSESRPGDGFRPGYTVDRPLG